ncbi:tRNA(Met) cytidine acetyltransferase TmcA [Aeropyrum pernix]|uniref:tRNA(Met) cytidine acetyltransferase TmcA n=1 Tax=Aeropyrum pernix TaxID=56636 RepID=UPI000AC59F5D|nr:tRNA(Met) cytidine acetyltransferase TmcA [Aeropyrum pernix]
MKSRVEIEREAIEVLKDLNKAAGPGFTRLVRLVGAALRAAIPKRHRVMVVISGSDPVRVGAGTARLLLYFERVYRRTVERRPLKVLYMFHDEFDDARLRKEIVKRAVKEKGSMLEQVTARYEESDRYLGTTFQALVLDLTNDLKPNDVGRLVEVVEGGGLIILQAPSWERWDTALTLFKKNLLVPGHEEPRHIFISWFKRKLLEHNRGIIVYDADSRKILSGEPEDPGEYRRREPKPPKKSLFPPEVYRLALTQDQLEAVRLMEWLYDKPPRGRKKMIVITADRGRGKSSALGIGLVALAHELGKVKHRVRIIVTAPSPSNVQSLMELAIKTAETLGLEPKPVRRGGRIIEVQGRKFSLEYWEPATVVRLQGDIVAVDEASGIHVPLLHKIWRAHRRLVFSATIHGYEGAGRGFNVRFLSAVKKSGDTIIREFKMEEPIRYAPGDPIERWLYNTLLLNAEPAELDEDDLRDIREGRLEYLRLDPQWLFSPEGEETLRQLFGIYVLAHYRNEPDDLGMLADAPHHSIRAVRTAGKGKIVSAAQVAEEGGLGEELIDRLLRGEKIAGNIIPDRMLKHARIREFGRMVGWRIVRIATHPEVQGRGIGSWLLERLYEESVERGYDWLGSGFGINEQLLRFWLRNGFLVLHLSPDRNPVSGEYTSLVMKPITGRARAAIMIAAREFKLKLLNSLHDTYRDMELEDAMLLLEMEPRALEPGYRPRLTRIQLDRLWIYNYGPMTYEAATDVIHELAMAYWKMEPEARPRLGDLERRVLVAKVLQAKSWGEVAQELGVREHKVMTTLKEAVRRMSRELFGLAEDSRVGVELHELGQHGEGELRDIQAGPREA